MAQDTSPLTQLAQCRTRLDEAARAQKQERERLATAKREVEFLETAIEEIEDGLSQDVFLARDAIGKPTFSTVEDRKREVRRRLRAHPGGARLVKERDDLTRTVMLAQLALSAADTEYRRAVDWIAALTAEVTYLTAVTKLDLLERRLTVLELAHIADSQRSMRKETP